MNLATECGFSVQLCGGASKKDAEITLNMWHWNHATSFLQLPLEIVGLVYSQGQTVYWIFKPHSRLLDSALSTIVHTFNWTHISIVYKRIKKKYFGTTQIWTELWTYIKHHCTRSSECVIEKCCKKHSSFQHLVVPLNHSYLSWKKHIYLYQPSLSITFQSSTAILDNFEW
jgi:hypothetical protein